MYHDSIVSIKIKVHRTFLRPVLLVVSLFFCHMKGGPFCQVILKSAAGRLLHAAQRSSSLSFFM
jgi:hypothetical protein